MVVNFVKANVKIIVKVTLSVVGLVGGSILAKQVIDETCFEERELGDVVVKEEAEDIEL